MHVNSSKEKVRKVILILRLFEHEHLGNDARQDTSSYIFDLLSHVELSAPLTPSITDRLAHIAREMLRFRCS